jgi:CubicO group peptidase (beta-lactamase class C family)
MPNTQTSQTARPRVQLPADFQHPTRVDLPTGHHLRPVTAADTDLHLRAVTESAAPLRSVDGQHGQARTATVTAQQHREELRRGETRMACREGYRYGLFDLGETELLGCVHIDPDPHRGAGADISWWVTDWLVDGPIDEAFSQFVPDWISTAWPISPPPRLTTPADADAARTHGPRTADDAITTGAAPSGVAAAVTTMMRASSVPGLSLAVVSREKVLWAGGYGLADRATSTAAAASTAYLWFSMTKVVTATAAVRLADEGRLDLAAPVGEYLAYLRAPGSEQPSVEQLMTHTAGLGNPLPIRWAHPAEAERPDPEVLLRRVMRGGRVYRYPVGRSARYSNVGYLALGQIIAAATGMPFEAYVQQSVLQPIGMAATGFTYSFGADPAVGYVKTPRIVDPLLRALLPPGIVGTRHGPYRALNPFYVDGPAYGGLVGNVRDAARFLRMHLRDGELDGHRILDPQSARRMRRITHPGKPFNHGIGWFRRPTTSPETWVEHFGTGVGFWNLLRLYPDRGIGVAIMTNSTTSYNFEPLLAILSGATWS